MRVPLRAVGAILFAASCALAVGGEDERALLDVRLASPFQREALLASGVDVWCGDVARAVVFARPEEVARLEADGFAFERLDGVLAEQRANAAKSPGAWPTFDQYVAIADGWVSEYPGLAHAFTIGASHEGRAIRMVRLSDNPAVDEDEPEILLLSLQHAREWLSGTTLRGIAEGLLDGYGTDAQATALLDNAEVYVLLVANPDGYAYTHSTDRFWRKNRRPVGSGNFGVDLNRNWPRAWQSSPNLGSEVYPGPSPLSEPENVALNAWLTNPARRLALTVNYHTFGAMAMHPWAHTATFAPNVDVASPLVQLAAADIEAVHGQRMRWGPWSTTLAYTGAGETGDYLWGTLGVPTFTFELRPSTEAMGGFAPTAEAISPAIEENAPAAMRLMQWAVAQGTDAAPPGVSDVAVSKISNTEATVSWTTDRPAMRRVAWGPTLPFANETEPDRLLGLKHSVRLTGLAPSTTYSFQAIATALSGAATFAPKASFATADAPQDIVAPVPPVLLSVARSAGGSVQVRWTAGGATGLAGHRLYESADLAAWTLVRNETQLPAGTTSALLAAQIDATRFFRLTNVDDSPARNESIPSDVYGVRLSNAAVEVAIVDGFDDWALNPVSQGANHTFAARHGAAVGATGAAFETYADEEFGVGFDPSVYRTIVWCLGHEGTANGILANAMGPIVANHVAAGGNLFVSASDAAARLAAGNATAQAFLADTLCASLVANDSGAWVVESGATDVFAQEPLLFDDGSRGIYRVASADSIAPLGDARAAFAAPNSATLGIVREGIFGDGDAEGKLVFLAFPFETIAPASRGDALMAEALEFFDREGDGADLWMLR